MRAFITALTLILALFLYGTAATAEGELLNVRVDWEQFLGRHDIVWEKLPERFDHGVWHGNGLLGAVIYKEKSNLVRWELGRSDVTTHRRDNSRLLIGGMGLETVGEIKEGTARYDLWNAESTGTIETTKGTITFRTLVHSVELVTIVELECSGDEKDARFVWLPWSSVDSGNETDFGDPPNPEPSASTDADVRVHLQPRYAGGEFATAWQEQDLGEGKRRLYVSIADTFPGKGAGREAVESVRKAVSTGTAQLRASHRAWWHAYYPKSFVSVPDSKIEGFYWIQIHKLACATRADRPVMDLLGPWFRKTNWPRIWWNLNIQTAYLSVYTANHLEIGESLTRMIDRNRDNFRRNAKEIWGVENAATVPHTTCYEGLRGDGIHASDRFINPGDFTWALHNYYLHYRYSMDHALVTDHKRHAFYPLLRESVNLYLHMLEPGDDGKLHLPKLHSPEYGHDSDNNYNLSLLRWACQTLLELNKRYGFSDPLAPRWQDVLDKLVEYQTDEHGLRIGATLSATKPHRHWSHMIAMHPLRTMNWEQPENRELMRKSVDFWVGVDGGRSMNAWSRASAASLYAGMGDGEKALENLNRHHDDWRFVMPNGMYIEGSPVIECGLITGRSLHDMLLQSWGGKIRVFPAVPEAWATASFHNLRAEGAFLVSAQRGDGRTQWIRVKSLAGEPCRVVHGFDQVPKALGESGRTVQVQPLEDGTVEVTLRKGEEAILFSGTPPEPSVAAIELDPATHNYWGVKSVPRHLRKDTAALSIPALSVGKKVTASSNWSPGYNAEKAVDGYLDTRWGAKPGSRSGWLAIDLGAEKEIGRVVIIEAEFPRTQAFVVEYKDGENWKELVRGTNIDGAKVLEFTPVRARHVRLNILKANEVPTLEEFRVCAPMK